MKSYVFLFVCLFLGLFIISLVSATPSFVFKQYDEVDLKISCFDTNNSLCLGTTACQLTINYPNQTNLVKNVSMTYNDNYFNYTLNSNQTAINGEYSVLVTCQGSTYGFSTYSFEINPIGIRASDQRAVAVSRSIYIMFGVAILFFLAFLVYNSNPSIKWSFGIIAFTMFLIALNVMFISLQDEVVNPKLETFFSSFVAISYYMYWFAGGMFLTVWTLTFFNTYFYKKNQQAIARYGE